MNIIDFVKENTESNEKAFGIFIRQRREELGLSIRGLSAQIGITPVYLSDIEKGNRKAPSKYLEAMAAALGLNSEDEKREFMDLASANRWNRYEDINPYLGEKPLARVALRRAMEVNLSDEDWNAIIRVIDERNPKK